MGVSVGSGVTVGVGVTVGSAKLVGEGEDVTVGEGVAQAMKSLLSSLEGTASLKSVAGGVELSRQVVCIIWLSKQSVEVESGGQFEVKRLVCIEQGDDGELGIGPGGQAASLGQGVIDESVDLLRGQFDEGGVGLDGGEGFPKLWIE